MMSLQRGALECSGPAVEWQRSPPIRYNLPCSRRGGRAVECGGLENRYASQEVSGVRIPPSPPYGLFAGKT